MLSKNLLLFFIFSSLHTLFCSESLLLCASIAPQKKQSLRISSQDMMRCSYCKQKFPATKMNFHLDNCEHLAARRRKKRCPHCERLFNKHSLRMHKSRCPKSPTAAAWRRRKGIIVKKENQKRSSKARCPHCHCLFFARGLKNHKQWCQKEQAEIAAGIIQEDSIKRKRAKRSRTAKPSTSLGKKRRTEPLPEKKMSRPQPDRSFPKDVIKKRLATIKPELEKFTPAPLTTLEKELFTHVIPHSGWWYANDEQIKGLVRFYINCNK